MVMLFLGLLSGGLLVLLWGGTSEGLRLGCNFEEPCPWRWNTSTNQQGFRVVTGQELNNSWVRTARLRPAGPFVDADNHTLGHFLYLSVKSGSRKEVNVWSPKYGRTGEQCKLSLWLHMSNMSHGNFKVVVETTNQTSWVVSEKLGNDFSVWQNYTFNIGRISQEFKIVLEVTPVNVSQAHTALDNIALINCFPDPPQNVCLATQFQCSNNVCIDSNKVCDINIDCVDGEDEKQMCDKVPSFARCTFEEGWCGWHNGASNGLNWTQNNGSTATSSTGPSFDHTYQNSTGMYLYVDMTGKLHDMGTASDLESPIINPPPHYHSNATSPYYNSCYITFHYHKFGPHSGSLGLFLIELLESTNISTKLWWSFGDKGNKWLRQVAILPNITNRYYFQIEARKSFASRGDPAIDDITMSPKCFGIGVPAAHLDGYDYYSGFNIYAPTPAPMPHTDFANETFYLFTTCGSTGRFGPTPENCSAAYNGTDTSVTVLTDKFHAGIQKWVVPETGYYTLILKGASGGRGSDGLGVSWGGMVRTVVELNRGQILYILVGQEGNNACRKNFSNNHRTVCQAKDAKTKPSKKLSRLHEIYTLTFLPEGGGGGGASYVFTMGKEKKVLAVASGGGGLGHGSSLSDTIQNGHGINTTLLPTTGDAYGKTPAGAGGGWYGGNYTYRDVTGLALLQGGDGGKACYLSSDGSDKGAGGFGGGGGGCTAGGGGGGYTGGRAWAHKSGLGEGGYSWIETGILQAAWVSKKRGPGEVYIIPAITGCECDFRCVSLDIYRSQFVCLCPERWHLASDNKTCLLDSPPNESYFLVGALTGLVAALLVVIAFLLTFLYNRYQKKKEMINRRKVLTGPDLQLNRLRVASDSMMTEYNPNYEFGGGTYSLRDLKEIPREHLRLVKALGQGAFGEVYQGFFKHRVGDAVEMPVAVKTLPELSTSQAETDFLMEALIMSKFSHPNIVHFIGVCFDKHPRFIVIELLAGGDLKTFLRESRPKPERASPLTMKDLLSCIMDVAKGCKYMEENRFIHRDIAARNCLLTTKGPGRVVKIADFGMARDIYRADYYRKGGKAMLPIKWMPPEAFLDGIFTSKTDVWSFGVLMWEVMSLGYMPYTGCANREVMQLVTNGGRLEPPTNCPAQLYAIMTQCWHPNPEERPPFPLLLERLGYCLQDPDVIKAPLPVYTKPPSAERDTTIMRPMSGSGPGEDSCLQPDYLVPLPGPEWTLPESATTALSNNEWSLPDARSASLSANEWTLPESRSTQPLLLENSSSSGTGSPATMANSNPPASSQLTDKPHHIMVNNHVEPPSLYIVSSHIKQDTEITC